MLPKDKQEIYRRIQASHIHASPDGPWFFIIARNDAANDAFQLMGITDTAMLRPQVFALQMVKCKLAWSVRRSRRLTRLCTASPRKTPVLPHR